MRNKILAATAAAALLLSGAASAQNQQHGQMSQQTTAQPGQVGQAAGMSFEQIKANHLQRLQEHSQEVARIYACVQASANMEAMKACHQGHQH